MVTWQTRDGRACLFIEGPLIESLTVGDLNQRAAVVPAAAALVVTSTTARTIMTLREHIFPPSWRQMNSVRGPRVPSTLHGLCEGGKAIARPVRVS